jgi:hypothetical protein
MDSEDISELLSSLDGVEITLVLPDGTLSVLPK